MSLTTGTRLGPYEILAPIGAGGMGEVYRARDTRLDRTVAIKVLPSDVAADAGARARFEREARAVAALNHPRICGLFDVGDADGTLFLVMPHLDGQTLAARLEKGPLPLDQALKITAEIADALDKAHRAGVVHRDLKPANIMLTRAGAMLLDFGLAKLTAPSAPISMSGMVQMATTTPGTGQGVILGTVQYMSPEQVEGKDADARSDIWGLGAVVYEMTTGVRPFTGETPASVIGAILKDDPPPISRRVPSMPAALDRIVARCFAKDPDERWQSAADLGHALGWIREDVLAPAAIRKKPSTSARLARFTVVLLALAAIAAMAPGWWTHLREPAPPIVRLSVVPPLDAIMSPPPASVVAPQLALSSDGRMLAFVAETPGSRPGLWVRALDAPDARRLPGTEDALYPFWSPDGQSLGFFAGGKLKTIPVSGGPAVTLSDAPLDSRGGTWSRDDIILFAPSATDVLYRIPARGGRAEPVTVLNQTRRENSHRFPSFLPDGRRFLYVIRSDRLEDWGIGIGSLDSPRTAFVTASTEWSAHYAEPGHLVFLQGGALMVQPFDADLGAVQGEAVALADAVGATTTAYAAISVSQNGVLAYARRIELTGQLQWFDRRGGSLGTVGPVAEHLDFELSPDETSLAMSRVDASMNTSDIWVFDLARGIDTRLTTDRSNDASPLWSPDGSTVIFRANRRGTTDLYRKRAGGGGDEERLLAPGSNLITSHWSADGRYLLYTSTNPNNVTAGFDIWAWPMAAKEPPTLVIRTALNAMHGQLSPDGKWVAYASDESDRRQVYVQRFPPTGDKRQISSGGGSEPRWRADGRELFFLGSDRRLMSAAIPGGDPFKAAAPAALFQTRAPLTGNPYRTNYTVTRDGQRFLVNTATRDTMAQPISVIVNWQSLVGR